jgi:hypothetical protein
MRFYLRIVSPTSNRLGEISFRTCAARAGAFIAVGDTPMSDQKDENATANVSRLMKEGV